MRYAYRCFVVSKRLLHFVRLTRWYGVRHAWRAARYV
jgi:hypothetical protein